MSTTDKRANAPRHLIYYEVREALAEDGCPVCRLATRAATRYLEMLLYESVNDPDVRERLRRSLGFCAPHAAEALEAGARLGLAIIYRDLLDGARARLKAGVRRKASSVRKGVCLRLTPHGDPALATGPRARVERLICPVCEQYGMAEERALEALADHLGEEEMGRAYDESGGLCLPHLLRLAEQLSEPLRSRLIALEDERMARLQQELAELIRKSDYRFREEPAGGECDAHRRAVAKIAGAYEPLS
jgi:hypothetical protein